MNVPEQDRFVWTDAGVRDALGLGAGAGASDLPFSGVSTDTRALEEGALFVALRGERFDGHRFLLEAVRKGARGAVVSDPSAAAGALPLYQVADTLVALGDLARYRRKSLPFRVVGITGSSGKTTVKDVLAAALRSTFRVHATRGNRNNRIGLPLTLLEAPEAAEIVVAEVGTNRTGEVAILTRIAEPDAALLTTVSESHLEGLGSLEGVLAEKLDLIRDLRPGGPAVVGDEPPRLPAAARKARPDVRVAGLSARADPEFRGELLELDRRGRYRLGLGGRELVAGLPGRHGAGNLVLALAMAKLLGAEEEGAVREACRVGPGALRGETRAVGGLTLLLDCYNANPQSVRAALDLLVELPASGRRVAVLGSMLELGERAEPLHREVLAEALRRPLDLVVAVGEFARAARGLRGERSGGPVLLAADRPEDGYRVLRPHLTGGETILLKGSRGLALERLLDRFQADFGTTGDSRDPGREA